MKSLPKAVQQERIDFLIKRIQWQAYHRHWDGTYVPSKINFCLTRKHKSKSHTSFVTLSQYKEAQQKYRTQDRDQYRTTNGITDQQIYRVSSLLKKHLQYLKQNDDDFAIFEPS